MGKQRLRRPDAALRADMWTRRTAIGALFGSAALSLMPEASEAAPRMAIVPFKTAPFPYEGLNPKTGQPFLDAMDGDKRGHTARDGTIYKEIETYSDRSVLLATSARFRPPRARLVVFLHGNGTKLQRDVIDRQQVVAQFLASGLNGALLVPQFAVDALDSSAGHFWENGHFAHFLDEAAVRLSALSGLRREAIAALPVVLVAYSGGYFPASSILLRGGAGHRIVGLVLLDALYGEQPIFADWIARNKKKAFFLSAFSRSTKDENIDFEAKLEESGIVPLQDMPKRLRPGVVAFVAASEDDIEHVHFVTKAWVENPLKAVLSRIAV